MVDDQEIRLLQLTHELHGHLGIYSTIGTKMGLLARELLGVRPSVLSYAGKKPPLSCLSDGIQVGAGATLGRGLIEVAPDGEPCARARFTAGGKTLTLQLKKEYAARIEADIATGVDQYGHSPSYWEYIGTLALKYGSEWDREEIFDIL